MKICNKCEEVKNLDLFYTHKKMTDGHLNVCKECVKTRIKERENVLKNDPEWLESERKRGREKHKRLGYKKKKSRGNEQRLKYPEKYKGIIAVQRIPLPGAGYNRHHWSYNEEHLKDIIFLTIKEHNKAHRFLVYDPSFKKYRRKDNNKLLETREEHEVFIRERIQIEED